MTPKERLLVTMRHGIPDRIPVVPDISNMIPAKLTGKPFWDIYLYQNPPLWKIYIDAVQYFGFDGFLDYQVPVRFPDEPVSEEEKWNKAIIEKTDQRIIVRNFFQEEGKIIWQPTVTVYPRDNPPTSGVPITKLGLPEIPDWWESVAGVREWPEGEEIFRLAYEMMADSGVVGICCGGSTVVHNEQTIYEYYDNPEAIRERSRKILEESRERFENILKMTPRPDYISCGGSGTLIFQTPDIFRDVSLPIVKEVTRWCKESAIISHVHSCGPERTLVQICAEETDLDVIDPLEIPPMGDCNLAELKKLFGHKLVLKGNLHTTNVMLKGTYQDVLSVSKKAIEDAASGGGFILSTGDQCGRDTPEENIFAMIEAIERYGRY